MAYREVGMWEILDVLRRVHRGESEARLRPHRERTEAKVAKPSTTLRKARLLGAGAHRWTDPGSSAEDRP